MERRPQVYWFKADKGQKDVLIFDAGRNKGFIHIYELKETLPAVELENQLKLNGFPMRWDITSKGTYNNDFNRENLHGNCID